jgi:hypothetical protein
MRKITGLLIIIVVISCCTEPGQIRKDTVSRDEVKPIQASTPPDSVFTKLDAEKILGEPAHLTDSATTLKADTLEYSSVYTANSKDPKTGKTGVIYFLFDQYVRVSIAQMVYSSIKTGNENHEGFKIIHDMGDEAYFHSDGQNFYFIIVRKGEKIFRMKVNKTTSTTSLTAFNQIAKNITAAL